MGMPIPLPLQLQLPIHDHPLSTSPYMGKNIPCFLSKITGSCSIKEGESNSESPNITTYQCQTCNFSVCVRCVEKYHTDLQNIIKSGETGELELKMRKCESHEHWLVRSKLDKWYCDIYREGGEKCKSRGRIFEGRWRCCRGCDYDQCSPCTEFYSSYSRRRGSNLVHCIQTPFHPHDLKLSFHSGWKCALGNISGQCKSSLKHQNEGNVFSYSCEDCLIDICEDCAQGVIQDSRRWAMGEETATLKILTSHAHSVIICSDNIRKLDHGDLPFKCVHTGERGRRVHAAPYYHCLFGCNYIICHNCVNIYQKKIKGGHCSLVLLGIIIAIIAIGILYIFDIFNNVIDPLP